MENWFEKAVEKPWPFFALGGAFIVWKVIKYLATRLFDEESGLLTNFLKGIREDSSDMKKTVAGVGSAVSEMGALQIESNNEMKNTLVEGLSENRVAIEKLENQLVNAIQAKPDDDELFHVLFTNNPIPICFVGADHRFTRLNQACDEFFGYSSGELSRMTFDDLTADKDIQADVDNVERVAAGSLQRYRMEKTYIKKSGEAVQAVLYVFRYPDAGAFLHYISIIIPKL